MSAVLAPVAGMLLEDAIGRACDRAAFSGESVAVCWTVSADPHADAVAFFAEADATMPRTLWLEPAREFALAGTGVAAILPSGGEDRFGAAGDMVRILQRSAVCGAEDGIAPVGPVALGGFRFDPVREVSLSGAGSPPRCWLCPRRSSGWRMARRRSP